MVRAHALRARTTGNNEPTENRALEGREESSHSFGLRRHAAANPGLRASRLTPGYSHRTPPAWKMANLQAFLAVHNIADAEACRMSVLLEIKAQSKLDLTCRAKRFRATECVQNAPE